MKLNVGSGHPKGIYRSPEWVNIDIAAKDHIDDKMCVLNVSVLEMPPDWKNKFDEVHCIHMLEHMNRNKRQEVLNHLCDVIAPGGKLYLEVPDFKRTIELLHNAYQEQNVQAIHIWKTSIYGKQRYVGDSHHWGFDAFNLTELACEAGFKQWETTTETTRMISTHWKQEPVILLIATK